MIGKRLPQKIQQLLLIFCILKKENADIESLIRKIDRCANNPEKSSAENIGEHIPCDYPM